MISPFPVASSSLSLTFLSGAPTLSSTEGIESPALTMFAAVEVVDVLCRIDRENIYQWRGNLKDFFDTVRVCCTMRSVGYVLRLLYE